MTHHCLPWLLILCICQGQAETPQQIFEKLEKRLLEAKSVQVTIKTRMKTPRDATVTTSFALVPKESKFHLDCLDRAEKGGEVHGWVVSNGTKAVAGVNKSKPFRFETPAHLSKAAIVALVRLESAAAWSSGIASSWITEKKVDPAAKAVPSNFKDSGKEKVGERQTRKLEFDVDVEIVETFTQKWHVVLWLDAETGLPVKKCVTVAGTDIVEEYADFKLDAEIPADRFKVE